MMQFMGSQRVSLDLGTDNALSSLVSLSFGII